MCAQVASVCICLLCYSMRPAPGPVPPAAPGVPSGPSGTWTHIIKTYTDDVEGQVELSGDSDSAIRNSPRLVAPSKQTTADYSRLNFCLVPGKLLVLLILILSRAVLKLCFYQWRSPYAWGLYQEVQSCLLHRGSHLVRGGPQRRTDVHVYKLLTATCMFIWQWGKTHQRRHTSYSSSWKDLLVKQPWWHFCIHLFSRLSYLHQLQNY